MNPQRHDQLPAVPFDALHIDDFGAVQLRGRNVIVGTANLKRFRRRGIALLPDRGGSNPPFVLIGKHLPPDGPMAERAAIHEALHVAFPSACEEQVEQAADFVAKVLGVYRRAREAKA